MRIINKHRLEASQLREETTLSIAKFNFFKFSFFRQAFTDTLT